MNLYWNSKSYFVFYFTIDTILKIFAEGLVLNENSYLRSPWNVLDFLVLIVSYTGIILSNIIIINNIIHINRINYLYFRF